MSKNIVQHNYHTTKEDRIAINGHKSMLLWLTGLSGSGKSTIANALEKALNSKGVSTYTLDGDNIRSGLNKDLTFAPEDRTENIRRIAEVAKLFIDAGVVVLGAFVSPYRKDRKDIENIVLTNNFIEIFVNTSIEECERRDVKGLYKKARAGEIENMTGISAPYEAPVNPHLEIKTERESVEDAVARILLFLKDRL